MNLAMKQYRAPWCTSLIVMSAVATLLCLGIGFGVPFLTPHGPAGDPGRYLRWLPLALVPICLLFTVRGYALTEKEILVHRLFWSTRLPRTDLQSAVFDPQALQKSLRTCGNGGFFSITGFYWNKNLGAYRAYLTDPSRTVVLRYSKRVVVLSPENPGEFIRDLGFES
jgi:hypothetical protein